MSYFKDMDDAVSSGPTGQGSMIGRGRQRMDTISLVLQILQLAVSVAILINASRRK